MSERLVKLLQGYIWYPREAPIDLADYLPQRLEPGLHLLWDEITPPFTFFDDGTFAATQHFLQFTVVKTMRDDDDAEALIPWLTETLQAKLEATPPGVGWQVFEDLREV